ncbi:MAG: YibE/F family protein [Coriobacteriia bacterium]|nr:YibE/F family protein [Coriobacteriia bacterium]MCL2871014.1 YibE/F family protein [Coriobacteriia bacterium]
MSRAQYKKDSAKLAKPKKPSKPKQAPEPVHGPVLAQESEPSRISKFLRVLFYVFAVALSAAFLYFGNIIATGDGDFRSETEDATVYNARVIDIVDRTVDDFEVSQDFSLSEVMLILRAEITSGDRRGETVLVEHHISDMLEVSDYELAVGDRIIIGDMQHADHFVFMDYQRINYIAILGAIFFVLVVVLGKMKGFNSIIALGFTCLAVFMVLIPAILSGHNIYVVVLIICAYTIISTFLIVIGPNRKSLTAIIGSLGGVLLAALLMLLMDGIMHLTGLIESDSRSLLYLPVETPIDLRAILFAGVILGSAGAVMDVAMSISSALWEIRLADAKAHFKSLLKSGIEIGRDTLGTMLNTLVLAYIGSSLTLILLVTAYATSLTELLNTEMITAEFLRALIGSFGMLFAIPLTAVICAWWFSRSRGTGDTGGGASPESGIAAQDEVPPSQQIDQDFDPKHYVELSL